MKPTLKHILLPFLALFGMGHTAWGEPGVAMAIVYDTSGSMSDTVQSAGTQKLKLPGGAVAQKLKYVSASEALSNIVDKIDAYAKSGNKVQAGIVCFPGPSKGENAVPFADWNPKPFRQWLAKFNTPEGGTPLGNAILAASKLVANSSLDKKHVVVITDGENNQGISPDEGARTGAEYSRAKNGGTICYYFVAFDTRAAQFGEVRKRGAVVLSAGNESELQKGLTNIFTQNILLEEEEK
jgi:uncharacterized protein YegL